MVTEGGSPGSHRSAPSTTSRGFIRRSPSHYAGACGQSRPVVGRRHLISDYTRLNCTNAGDTAFRVPRARRAPAACCDASMSRPPAGVRSTGGIFTVSTPSRATYRAASSACAGRETTSPPWRPVCSTASCSAADAVRVPDAIGLQRRLLERRLIADLRGIPNIVMAINTGGNRHRDRRGRCWQRWQRRLRIASGQVSAPLSLAHVALSTRAETSVILRMSSSCSLDTAPQSPARDGRRRDAARS